MCAGRENRCPGSWFLGVSAKDASGSRRANQNPLLVAARTGSSDMMLYWVSLVPKAKKGLNEEWPRGAS